MRGGSVGPKNASAAVPTCHRLPYKSISIPKPKRRVVVRAVLYHSIQNRVYAGLSDLIPDDWDAFTLGSCSAARTAPSRVLPHVPVGMQRGA